MKKFTLFLLLLISITSISLGQLRTNFEKNTFKSGNYKLPYRFLKPKNISDSIKYPLILFLHSETQAGNDNEKQLNHFIIELSKNKKRVKYPSFIIAPQIPRGKSWTSAKTNGDSLSFSTILTKELRVSLEIVDKTIKSFPIDTNRIYIVGISDGAVAAFELLCKQPEKAAAILSICGTGQVEEINEQASLVPFWAFIGKEDLKYSSEKMAKIISYMNENKGKAKLTVFDKTNHICWDETLKNPEIFNWLFQQSK